MFSCVFLLGEDCMKEKRNWESPEEKDIYYEKRKKERNG